MSSIEAYYNIIKNNKGKTFILLNLILVIFYLEKLYKLSKVKL